MDLTTVGVDVPLLAHEHGQLAPEEADHRLFLVVQVVGMCDHGPAHATKLVLGAADDPAECLVDLGVRAVEAGDEHPDGGGLEPEPEQLLRSQEVGRAPVALGHVPRDGGAAHNPPVGGAHRRDRHLDCDLPAVLGSVRELGVDRLALAGGVREHIPFMLRRFVGHLDPAQRTPDHLLGAVAVDPLRAAVPARHDAVEVRADDRVAGRVHDRGQGADRAFGSNPQGDIPDSREDGGPGARRQRRERDLGLELASVLAHRRDGLAHETRGRLLVERLSEAHVPLPVRRWDQRLDRLTHEPAASPAEQILRRGVGERDRTGVVNHDRRIRGRLQQRAEPLLGCPGAHLGSLALRDIPRDRSGADHRAARVADREDLQ